MDLRFFREHHYQVLRGVIDSKIATSVRAFLSKESESTVAELQAAFGVRDYAGLCSAIDAAFTNGKSKELDRDLQLKMTGHFSLQTRLSRELWAIPKLPTVRAVLEDILEDDRLYMHMPPTARFVLPGNVRAGVPPHRDVSYNEHMNGFVILWVPLTRIDEKCGGVGFFEGSQRDRVKAEGHDGFWLSGVDSSGYPYVHPHLEVGDALLISQWLLHQSSPNVSDHPRFSIDFRFMSSNHASTKHVLDMQKWQIVEPGGKAL